jgi:hypothetical protein
MKCIRNAYGRNPNYVLVLEPNILEPICGNYLVLLLKLIN